MYNAIIEKYPKEISSQSVHLHLHLPFGKIQLKSIGWGVH